MNRRNMWLVIIPVILFAMLGLYIKAGLTVGFENWAYNESVEEMSPGVTAVVKGVTHIGDAYTVIIFCLLLFVIPKTRRTIALPVSSAVILAAILNIALKHIFVRERPDILRLINEKSYSFPSGHAMINGALYTILILLIFKYIKNYPLKLTLSVICLVLMMAIGFSRVYLGVHYAGDIIGGWILGLAVTFFVYFMWKKSILREERKAEKP